MICNRQSRLRAVMLAAIVAAGAGLRTQATIYRDCFDVEFYGDIRHVACTIDGLTDIHYAVDKFKTNGLFRISFPEDVLWEKNPQPAHLFRINLSDKAGGLW